MNSWKVILATMVIFGTGVMTGGLMVGLRVDHSRPPDHPPGQAGFRPGQQFSPGGMRLELLRRIGQELDLTPEKREQVDKVLRDSQERTRKVMAPILREEMQRTAKEFRDVLTAEQQARFDDLLKQRRARVARTNSPPAPSNINTN